MAGRHDLTRRGSGIRHDAAASPYPGRVRLLPGSRYTRRHRLVLHPDARDTPRVAAVHRHSAERIRAMRAPFVAA